MTNSETNEKDSTLLIISDNHRTNEKSKIGTEYETRSTIADINNQQFVSSVTFKAMVVFQIFAYGSYSVLVHLCEKNGKIEFSSTTMNFILELTKLLFSLNAFLCCPSTTTSVHSSALTLRTVIRHSLPYSIPAILYFINNNLAVHMQLQMDPTSYQILSNFKILTTAILYRIIMKQYLNKIKWLSLVLLFAGGLSYSLGASRSSASKFLSSTTPSSLSVSSSGIVIGEMYIHPLGIPMITIYCILSGLAGVYNEWILKKYYLESLNMQNIYLYTYGTIFNFIPAFYSQSPTSILSIESAFKGFSIYTWLIILTQTLNGLFMSVVIKHSSNITRLFVISFSVIVTTLLKIFFSKGARKKL
ncbi:unnamed protein product [Didymodactylos carnosus]|uniref:UDP-sugar transporter protein SLC35A4 n=2 Tax=Didymodactylos carnosus TaxID=1234261 RepID=A0A814CWN5_9BILA|nr:unnamed protein product [Didymodactylos carnosus]CAF3721841.1 unnamed protein product [Didymodactylos carnosus]